MIAILYKTFLELGQIPNYARQLRTMGIAEKTKLFHQIYCCKGTFRIFKKYCWMQDTMTSSILLFFGMKMGTGLITFFFGFETIGIPKASTPDELFTFPSSVIVIPF